MLEGSSDCRVEARPEGLGWEQGDDIGHCTNVDRMMVAVLVSLAVEVVSNRQFLCMWIYVTHTHIYVKGKIYCRGG